MKPKLSFAFSIFFSFLCIFCCTVLCGQPNIGTAVTAMCAINNPAGIGIVTHPCIGLSYSTAMNLPELSTQTVVFLFPVSNNRFGITAERYGFNAFNQLSSGFVYSRKFGTRFTLGSKFNYHQISAADYGAVSGFSIDLGTLYIFNDKIALGAYIRNPTRQEYPVDYVQFPITSIYAAELSWKSSDQVIIAGTLIKEYGRSADFRTGIAYNPFTTTGSTEFILRAGISIKPLRHYAGFGIKRKSVEIDFTITSDVQLGYRPQIAMGYVW